MQSKQFKKDGVDYTRYLHGINEYFGWFLPSRARH